MLVSAAGAAQAPYQLQPLAAMKINLPALKDEVHARGHKPMSCKGPGGAGIAGLAADISPTAGAGRRRCRSTNDMVAGGRPGEVDCLAQHISARDRNSGWTGKLSWKEAERKRHDRVA